MYQYHAFGKDQSCFVNSTQNLIININRTQSFISSIFFIVIEFGELLFQQTIGSPMGINCATLATC
jgi:hypothetical protein